MVGAQFFEGAGLRDMGRLHFMNWPVASGARDPLNPWQLLKSTVSAEDFVVVKLDIDTPSVELELIDQLIADPELHGLVDVFYFEHHVYIHDFEWCWGRTFAPQTLRDSYAIFDSLRRLGIAAHSWP